MRLIDADALGKSMRKSINERYINWTKTITVADIATLIFDEIAYAPTVDIKPFALFSFDKDELERIVEDSVIEPIKNGELVVKEERPQGEWIPVGERLPEGKIEPTTNDFELVLCSTVWGIVRPYKFGKPIGHDKAHFWSGAGVMDDYVIAWMPLPEIYKEADND